MASGYDKKSVVSEPADIRKNLSDVTHDQSTEPHDTRKLKRVRSAAKGIVTRNRNDISELLSYPSPNIDELKKGALDLEAAMKKFLVAHENYHKNLQNPEDIEESDEYYNAERTRVNYLKERITNLLENPINPHDDVRPEDSVSNAGASKLSRKSKSSKFSRISSTSSAKAKAIVRKATLEAEAAKLEKKIALQKQELHLQQQREALELEIELAKAKAEERAYNEIETVQENLQLQPPQKNEKSPVQKNPQLPPPQKNEESPVQINSQFSSPQKNEQKRADEMEFKRQQESQFTHQPLNPNAKEWIHGPKLESQLTYVNARVAESSVNRTELRNNDTAHMMTNQMQQNKQIERLMIEQRRHNAALLLPQPEVPIFKGDPIEFCSFIRAFETLIETKTDDSSARLYFLVQYTAGDVQELLRSCLAMDPEEGYKEARRLLKEKYGQNYKIAAAYVDQLTKGTPMRTEDGAALQKFSVLLTSCRNTLKDIGYLNKLENPAN